MNKTHLSGAVQRSGGVALVIHFHDATDAFNVRFSQSGELLWRLQAECGQFYYMWYERVLTLSDDALVPGTATVTAGRLGRAADEVYEYSVSQETINVEVGDPSLSIAYPNCRSGDEDLCSQYYIAGRNCSGGINPTTPSNMYEIKVYICGNRGSVKDMGDFEARNSDALADGGEVLIENGATVDEDPPAMPTNLTATAVGGHQIDLNWDDNTDEDLDGYRVYENGVEIAFVSASELSDTDLLASTQY